MGHNSAGSRFVTGFTLGMACLLLSAVGGAVVSPTTRYHGLVGDLEKVDTGAKKITVRAADGTVHAFSYGGQTVVHGLEATARAADLAGKEGSRVLVHYTGGAGREAAVHIDVFGRDTLKTTEGTISEVDKAGKKVVVKGTDGVNETYDLGKDSALDTKHGIVDVAHYTGRVGDHVIVYHTEEGGRKVVHLLKHL